MGAADLTELLVVLDRSLCSFVSGRPSMSQPKDFSCAVWKVYFCEIFLVEYRVISTVTGRHESISS